MQPLKNFELYFHVSILRIKNVINNNKIEKFWKSQMSVNTERFKGSQYNFENCVVSSNDSLSYNL